ncbi:MAG: hypothetical protein K2V38_05760, partial [Gemmataceae bacterium]|nr:hypothetical protein [Gemmataceae bacterium]
MDSGFANLKLFAPGPARTAGGPDTADGTDHPTPLPLLVPIPAPVGPTALDPHTIATRELIRPPGGQPSRRACEPYSAAWFDEIEQKRYQRHGHWLPRALEFGRHPGESLLV